MTRPRSFREMQGGEDDDQKDHRKLARMIQTAREPDNVEWPGSDACEVPCALPCRLDPCSAELCGSSIQGLTCLTKKPTSSLTTLPLQPHPHHSNHKPTPPTHQITNAQLSQYGCHQDSDLTRRRRHQAQERGQHHHGVHRLAPRHQRRQWQGQAVRF